MYMYVCTYIHMCWKQDTVLCLKHYLQLLKAFRQCSYKNVVLEAREVKGAKGKGKRQRADDNDDSDNQTLKRQYTLPSTLRNISSTKLHNALFEYIIEDMYVTTIHS